MKPGFVYTTDFIENVVFTFILLLVPTLSKGIGEIKGHESLFREQLTPTLGGIVPSSAFDWTRLIFNNLDSRGISIPDGIPSSDRLQDGRSDQIRLTLSSGSKFAPHIPSTYLIRNPVEFSLFPNPEEKPASLESNKNNSEEDDAVDFRQPNYSETCQTLECKDEGELPEEEHNYHSGKSYLNNDETVEEHPQPDSFPRYGKFPFMKDSRGLQKSHLYNNLRYGEYPSAVLPNMETMEVHLFSPVSNLHDHPYFHQVALNYILSNSNPKKSSQFYYGFNRRNLNSHKPSQTLQFHHADKAKSIKRKQININVRNVLKELLQL